MELVIKYIAIVGSTTGRYFLFSGLAFVFFYILFYKRMNKAKIQEKEANKQNFLNEIYHSLQSIFVLAGLAFVALFTPIRQYTLVYENINEYPIWWILVSFTLSLLIHDTYFYWMHRLLHHKNIYKFTHKVHHLSLNPSPFASYSFHLFEAVTEGLVVFIVVFTVPMHPLTLFLFTLIGFLINIYGHLGFEIMPKWFRTSILFQWLNTSVYHNIHHSTFKGNYSLYFRHWDKWMKTENPDYVKTYDAIQEKRFGTKSIKKVVVIVPIFLLFFCANAQIEGKWHNKETGDVVEVYKINELIFAKAIHTKNEQENQLLKKKQPIVLSQFKQKDPQNYCCGTIYLPRKKITVEGELVLINHNKMLISGHYGYISKTLEWNRL